MLHEANKDVNFKVQSYNTANIHVNDRKRQKIRWLWIGDQAPSRTVEGQLSRGPVATSNTCRNQKSRWTAPS